MHLCTYKGLRLFYMYVCVFGVIHRVISSHESIKLHVSSLLEHRLSLIKS